MNEEFPFPQEPIGAAEHATVKHLGTFLRASLAVGAAVALAGGISLAAREAIAGDVVQVCTTSPQGIQEC